jgi:hypothetical protein
VTVSVCVVICKLCNYCVLYVRGPLQISWTHFEISSFGAPFSWLGEPKNRVGRDLDCMVDVLMVFHRSTFSEPNTEFKSDLAPCDFWAFPTMRKELRGKKFRSVRRSASRFREVRGAL